MKSIGRRSVIAITTICLLFAAGACGSSSNDADSNEAEKYVIGWSDPQGKQPIFRAFTSALEAAAKRENIKLITLDARLDVGKQVSDIETFITQKVDAIIIFPNNAKAVEPALKRAHDAGIKIIGYNASIGKLDDPPKVVAPYDVELDMGYPRGAAKAGEFVAKEIQGKGNVIGIKIPPPVPSLVALLDLYETAVTDGNPDIRWIGTAVDETDDLAGANRGMLNAITRNKGDIDAVMSYTDIAGIGAFQALETSGKSAVIIGQQGSQTAIDAIKADKIQGTVNVMPWMQAVYALAIARDLAEGKKVPSYVEGPIQFITKDNVSEYVSWKQGIQNIKDDEVSLNIKYK